MNGLLKQLISDGLINTVSRCIRVSL